MSRLGVVGGSATPERSVRVRVPGKINLALRSGAVGADGFHPLSTIFQAVSIFEEVTAHEGDGIGLRVTGPQADLVPTDENNIAVRAALLLAEHVGVDPDVSLHIHKDVPVAGGMAGGSADAAGTLVACDALWDTALPREELLELAAELGSDVPFALLGHTAIGTGRGHLLSPVMTRGTFHWVLALREQGMSTPRVYEKFDEVTGGSARLEAGADNDLLLALRQADPIALGDALHNDLQEAAVQLRPELGDTLELAHDAGALGALVSGSGPTVAVLARSAQHALTLSLTLLAEGAADDVRTATGPVQGAVVVAG